MRFTDKGREIGERRGTPKLPSTVPGFDAELHLDGHGGALQVALSTLSAAANLLGMDAEASRPARDKRGSGYELDLSHLEPGTPIMLWRGGDGWLAVATPDRSSWRTFCGAFLNLSAFLSTTARDAWASPSINSLATDVLDTHPVWDAVGTCQTYGVPAAVVPGWHDDERPCSSRALAERLAWAVVEECEI